MRLNKVDLNLFVVLDALHKERSVTKTAARLHLTQPAVSNALARLRKSFNDPLFVRTPEGMTPTPVADNVMGDVRRALELLTDSVGTNARFDPKRSQKQFRLGMNDLAISIVLPRLYDCLRQESPNVSVSVLQVARKEAAEELKSGTVDLLIDNSIPNARELEQLPFAVTPYVVVMRKTHPLARKNLTLDQYLRAQHVHVSSRRRGRGHVDIALNKKGLQRSIVMRMYSYLAAAHLASQTDLLLTAPAEVTQIGGLKSQRLPFESPPLEWTLFWPRSAQDDHANSWMREKILWIGKN